MLFNSTQWTYSTWVNATTNPGTGLTAFIIAIGGGGSGGAQDLLINNQYVVSSQGFMTNSYHAAGNTPSNCISGTLPVPGTWYHVAAIRETDTVRIYVNGVEMAKMKTLSTAITYGAANSAYIAARSAGTDLFNGYLDDIRIYSRPLSAAEVNELYVATNSCAALPLRKSFLAYSDF